MNQNSPKTLTKMKTINDKFQQMLNSVPQDISNEIDLSFAIATEISILMQERGLSKKQFADALGKTKRNHQMA